MKSPQSAVAAIDSNADENRRPLPDSWRWVGLGDVCTITMGQSPVGTSYNAKGHGEPLLNGPTEFGNVNPSAIQWTTSPTKYAEEGDILLCVRGATTGRKNIADRRYCIGRGLAGIRGRQGETITEFIWHVLDLVTTSLLKESAGSTFPNLPGEKLERIRIPLPPLAEQKRIAFILTEQLSAVNCARAAAEAQLKAAKALMYSYLRLFFNSSNAEKWPRKAIRDIAETCSGTTPSRSRADYYLGVLPWVKTGELLDGIISDTEEHVSETALRDTALKLLPANTLLIAMYGQGQTRGRTGILAVPATINQACFAILPSAECDTSYLQFWFVYSYDRLRRETEGRGGNQPNLNGDVLRSQIVPLPSLEEQRSIAKLLNEKIDMIRSLITTVNEQLRIISSLPSALLRQAFSGEI